MYGLKLGNLVFEKLLVSIFKKLLSNLFEMIEFSTSFCLVQITLPSMWYSHFICTMKFFATANENVCKVPENKIYKR